MTRRDAFDAGLVAAGYDLVGRIDRPAPGDLMVMWNRYADLHEIACRFEAAGGTVLVAENGHLGKGWRDGGWISLAVSHHCGAGRWHDAGPSRWDGWGVELGGWREGPDTIVFEQRGIGEPDVRAPVGWADGARRRFGGRVRHHPATHPRTPELAIDLETAGQAITWNSGAALQALLAGVPVWYEFDAWIGAGASRHVREWGEKPRRDDARLAMFRRLAWAMWQPHEISSGEAIRTVTA